MTIPDNLELARAVDRLHSDFVNDLKTMRVHFTPSAALSRKD